VVGVGVGHENRLDPLDPGGEHLEAHLRGGIHEQVAAASAAAAVPGTLTRTEGRRRRFRRSGEVHTAQAHPIIGMPVEVPVPRNVMRSAGAGGGGGRGGDMAGL
jgi:hypothetical protein